VPPASPAPGPRAVITAEAAAGRLRVSGRRLTPSRQALLELLGSSVRPLAIHEILALDPDLAQSTVYRNLVALEAAGVVHRVVTGDGFARFELADDLAGHHHHLVCRSCGSVEDVPATRAVEASLEAMERELARQRGFRPENHRIDLVGVCRDCA